MKNDDIELVRGSGNVYRDFGRPNADLEQARALTAAKIIRINFPAGSFGPVRVIRSLASWLIMAEFSGPAVQAECRLESSY